MTMANSKLVTFTDMATVPKARPKPPAAGKGRPKGAVNKTSKALKDMILGALEGAGGESYLQRQAEDNPTAFLSLIGRVLPTELKNAEPGGFVIKVVTGVPDPDTSA
jgi:hypothetical protein